MLTISKILKKLDRNEDYIPKQVQGIRCSDNPIDEKLNIVKIYKYLAEIMLSEYDINKINSQGESELIIKDRNGEFIIAKLSYEYLNDIRIYLNYTEDFFFEDHEEIICKHIWLYMIRRLYKNESIIAVLLNDFKNTENETFKINIIAKLSDFVHYHQIKYGDLIGGIDHNIVENFYENNNLVYLNGIINKKHNVEVELDDKEVLLIQKLGQEHVPSDIEITILKEIYTTWNKGKEKVDVVLLEGSAGSGKTEIAKAISCHLRLPYRKMTCSSNTEEMSLTGAIMPKLDEGNSISDQFYKSLGKEAKINFENISKAFKIPSLYEASILVSKVDKFLNGYFGEKREYDEIERNAKLVDVYNYYFEKLSNSSKEINFSFIESQFVEALKGPGVFEVQEPASIKDEGVLQILNSVLEYDGLLELPNYKQIKKHKDCIIFFTTNRGYAGNKTLNQALRDRAKIAFHISLPNVEQMVERVSSICNITDKDEKLLVMEMATLIRDLRLELIDEGIRGGELGMRSFIEWVRAYKRGNSISNAFAFCCAYKVTTDEGELHYIEDKCKNISSLFNSDKLNLV